MKIVIDTREVNPMDFTIYGFEQINKALSQGDYSIEGYEDRLSIERKASPSEIAGNLGKHKDRFFREMERLSGYDTKFIVCEFSRDDLLDFPENMPPKLRGKIKTNGGILLSQLNYIESKYGVSTIFCQDRFIATEKICDIFFDFLYRNQ